VRAGNCPLSDDEGRRLFVTSSLAMSTFVPVENVSGYATDGEPSRPYRDVYGVDRSPVVLHGR